MKNAKIQTVLLSAALTLPATVYAQAMPWEGPICKIANSFSGPVAVAFVVLAVVLCGAMLAFGELSGVFRTLLGVAIGGAMAVGAVQWVTMFTSPKTLGCLSSVDGATRVAEVVNPIIASLSSFV